MSLFLASSSCWAHVADGDGAEVRGYVSDRLQQGSLSYNTCGILWSAGSHSLPCTPWLSQIAPWGLESLYTRVEVHGPSGEQTHVIGS